MKQEDLIIKGLKFKYPGAEANILHNISLTIPKGAAIAIVGGTGSGKTTLLNIINGLITPLEGNIFYNGNSIFSDLKSWQRKISYVSQDIFLTDRSITQNIAFGVEEAEIDREKVKDSLVRAELYDYVETLPAKLGTIVGERGVQLSGGQRQRVAIARALYFDSEIIIFDEGTSALDNITERKIINALYSLKGKKLSLWLLIGCHQFKTVTKFFVVNNGCIEAFGAYHSLVNKDGVLREMSQSHAD